LPLKSIASGLRKQFISENEGSVTDITQLGCPSLADISLPGIICTFACHKSRYVCALRPAYSLAQWLKFTFLVCSLQSVLLSLLIIDVFQMTGLLRRTFFFSEKVTMYAYIYLNEDFKPQVKLEYLQAMLC